jgi:hypothetical protein
LLLADIGTPQYQDHVYRWLAASLTASAISNIVEFYCTAFMK